MDSHHRLLRHQHHLRRRGTDLSSRGTATRPHRHRDADHRPHHRPLCTGNQERARPRLAALLRPRRGLHHGRGSRTAQATYLRGRRPERASRQPRHLRQHHLLQHGAEHPHRPALQRRRRGGGVGLRPQPRLQIQVRLLRLERHGQHQRCRPRRRRPLRRRGIRLGEPLGQLLGQVVHTAHGALHIVACRDKAARGRRDGGKRRPHRLRQDLGRGDSAGGQAGHARLHQRRHHEQQGGAKHRCDRHH